MPIFTEDVGDTLDFADSLGEFKVTENVDTLQFNELVGLSANRASLVEFWTRWIIASVAKHFDQRRRNLPMFLEGEDHLATAKELIEVRVDGPYIREPSAGFFDITIEVNVLIITSKSDIDLFSHYRNVGTINQAFMAPISVFKLGLGIDDDQSLLGCLTLVRSVDQREALRVSHFGQVDVNTPLMRSSIEGHYNMQLHG